MIRLLLDENFPLGLTAGLVAAGHDVRAVALISPGIDDLAVLAMSRAEQRCLVTFDADFGDLVFHHRAAPPPAIYFLRLHPIVPAEVLALTIEGLRTQPPGGLIVITREGFRRRAFDMTAAGGSP